MAEAFPPHRETPLCLTLPDDSHSSSEICLLDKKHVVAFHTRSNTVFEKLDPATA